MHKIVVHTYRLPVIQYTAFHWCYISIALPNKLVCKPYIEYSSKPKFKNRTKKLACMLSAMSVTKQLKYHMDCNLTCMWMVPVRYFS